MKGGKQIFSLQLGQQIGGRRLRAVEMIKGVCLANLARVAAALGECKWSGVTGKIPCIRSSSGDEVDLDWPEAGKSGDL